MSDQAPERKPISFTAFYESTLKSLRAVAQRLYAPPAKPESAKEREARLHEAVARGRRLRILLASDAWKRDLAPFLAGEAAAAHMRPWVPGDPVEAAKLRAEFFFLSGKAYAYAHPLKQMEAWIREGEEAQKTLEYESRKAPVVETRRFL